MPKPKRTEPFTVGELHEYGQHLGYCIMLHGRPFLRQASADERMPDDRTPRLKRPQAYAIARVLNGEQGLRKWADRFSDPYPAPTPAPKGTTP